MPQHAIEDIFKSIGGTTRRLRVSLSGRDRWEEGSLFLESKVGRHRPICASDRFVGNGISKKTYAGFGIIIFLLFFALLGRMFSLQVLSHTAYLQLAEGNRQRILPIPAERGIIFDKNRIALTKNIPKFSLALTPQDLPRDFKEREKIVRRLAELIGRPSEDIHALLDEYGSYSFESIIIQDNLDYETALAIHIAAADLPGLYIQRGSRRLYVNDTARGKGADFSLSHVLGYMGKLDQQEFDTMHEEGYLPSDTIGKTGVEKVYERALRGAFGKKRIEVNALGKEQHILAEHPPIPGNHLVLTIDTAMQAALVRIMEARLLQTESRRAAGIIMNPSTGSIYALVSLPAFDANEFLGGISEETYQTYLSNTDMPLFNRAVSGLYPSGSTIKPAIAAAALEEGTINSETSFLSTGGIQIDQWFFPDWQAGGHGITNVRKAIAWSVNTFFYTIGGGNKTFDGLGVSTITYYLRRFGFAEKLGIDLPAEAEGFLPSKEWKEKTKAEPWYIGDTYNLSIGQGDVLVTPLQIAAYTASIANGGTLYVPRLADIFIDALTKEEKKVTSKIIRDQVVSPRHINTVRLGMRDCVMYGSCRRLSSLPFAVAGKTGTAQWNNEKPNHAWFTGFAPFEDPEIAITILVEEGGEGSQTAIPIAHAFLQWWWNYAHKGV